jgi:hypothetical protein
MFIVVTYAGHEGGGSKTFSLAYNGKIDDSGDELCNVVSNTAY